MNDALRSSESDGREPSGIRIAHIVHPLVILAALTLALFGWGCGEAPAPTVEKSPTPVAAECTREGLAFSPYRDGQDPNIPVEPLLAEITSDLAQLRSVTCSIRTYRSASQFGAAASEAARLGLVVTAGAYIGTDTRKNEEEVAAVIDLARAGTASAIVVGNETQLMGQVSESQLLDYIARVRAAVPSNVRVTTAEPWGIWLGRPQLAAAVDYILIHVHPFWEGVDAERASSYVASRYQDVAARYPDRQVEVGEAGWPSDGRSEDAGVPSQVVPSAENERLFIEQLRQEAARLGIRYFLHEAYDQEFKWSESVRSQGALNVSLLLDRNLSGRYAGSSWGIFRSNGQLKPALTSLFPNAGPSSSRGTRTVFDERGLATFYDMGVDSSRRARDWLRRVDEDMRMAYPPGQAWGAVFVTVGKPTDPPRPWKDFSAFRSVCTEMRGDQGGEVLQLGMKDASDRDDGSESRVTVRLTSAWTSYCYDLNSFPSADMSRIYLPIEFVFDGPAAETVYFRRVQFLP